MAFNPNGATTGITMPSVADWQALIRSTYARAGLDLSEASDRHQFFEAYRTGAPVGDPIEAEAIAKAFSGEDNATNLSDELLYVGSIKTILRYTEGTARFAVLLKTSLALQNSTAPSKMLLHNLSDSVVPFTQNL
jgi:acyl transferase domain-containing protein